jgi:hypothetical protein
VSVDPGPAPAQGLAVRPESTGFHARAWPAPPTPWARLGAAAVAFGAIGFGAAAALGRDPSEQAAVAAAVPSFGLLLVLLSWLPGLAPVELEVTDHQVYWHGERYAWDQIAGARASGGTLELLGRDGRRLDGVEHLRPEVATWLARAIDASRPDAAPPSGGT